MGWLGAVNGMLGIVPALVWAIALAGALLTAGVEKVRFNHLTGVVKIERAEHIQAVADAKERVNAAEKANQSKIIEAQNAKAKNQIAIQAAAAGARSDLYRLRDTTSAFVAKDTASARNVRAETLAIVFGQCTDELAKMGESADRIESDRQLLLDSWPR